MRFLSLFSGIEAASVAWESLGWEAVAFSEIEPFPCEVLRQHYPNTPNLGDVTAITEKQIKSLGRIDLVVFGSPCQDLSVAGKREGFNGERSSLFRDAMRVIQWARKNNGCRFALWENVPGAFTSNQGADFTEVLRSLTGAELRQPEKWRNAGVAIGKEGLTEWRTLDAQFFGVPQRRRRIFALADFGDYSRREPVLFESESVQRDSNQSREAQQKVASLTASGVGTCGADDNQACAGHIIPTAFDMTAFGQYGPGNTASTIKQRDYKDATDLVVFNPKDDPVHSESVSMPLQAQTAGNSAAIAIHDKATRHKGGDESRNSDGAGNGQVVGALAVEAGAKQQNYIFKPEHVVRRLTPIECERLQGFPDNYTQIPWKNKPAENCPDGPRYKALGNSMAVPVMRWIGQQLDKAMETEA